MEIFILGRKSSEGDATAWARFKGVAWLRLVSDINNGDSYELHLRGAGPKKVEQIDSLINEGLVATVVQIDKGTEVIVFPVEASPAVILTAAVWEPKVVEAKKATRRGTVPARTYDSVGQSVRTHP